MRRTFAVAILVTLSIPAYAERDAWVTVDSLNRRTCPASTCGIVGVKMFRERATIYEEKNGWARITKYYDAACQNGVSRYVDSGNNKCTPNNGIKNGSFSEWVSIKYLSATRPSDPAANASGDYALVKGSDDYRLYKDAFAKAASKLIAFGKCSETDFKEIGGWMRSSNHKDKPMYFTYCGGMRISNKVYLNASTGEVTK
jgi:hypothetical protein